MTQYKNQHFLPQFYLRRFSDDRVGLCRYSLSDEITERSNIERTCARFYFYAGSALAEEWETTFSRLEMKHAEIIQEILDQRNLSMFSAQGANPEDVLQDYLFLCNFILLTAARTELKKKELHEIANWAFDLMKEGIAQSEEAKTRGITKEDLDRLELRRDTANLESIENALLGPILISDLAPVLIINETDNPFITSDSPTILYNFLKLGDLGMLGWQSPGLMLLLPLSEEIMIGLFDPDIYLLNINALQRTLTLTRKQDVDEINRLQVLNADEYLIFSKLDYNDYVSSLHKPLKNRLRETFTHKEKKAEFQAEGKQHAFYMTRNVGINYKPHLSFLKINKARVEQYKNAFREQIAPKLQAAEFRRGMPPRIMRNEALFESFLATKENIMKKIASQESDGV